MLRRDENVPASPWADDKPGEAGEMKNQLTSALICYSARSAALWIFPAGVMGKDGRNMTCFGTL